MIQSIYETHLHVRNLEKAIDFYQNKLGLALARKLSKRRVAFFWVGENKKQMLGLWEVHNIEDFETKHFAFGVDLEFLKTSKLWLEKLGIEVIGSQGKGNQEPIVQRWMPAASVYFLDCDGNKLEFISMLHDNPDELEYASYLSEWDDSRSFTHFISNHTAKHPRNNKDFNPPVPSSTEEWTKISQI